MKFLTNKKKNCLIYLGGKVLGKGGVGEMKFFTEDAPGLKVHPKTVLVISLVYIGIVVLLHIWSKIGGGTPKAEAGV